jgi:hypothetical protein
LSKTIKNNKSGIFKKENKVYSHMADDIGPTTYITKNYKIFNEKTRYSKEFQEEYFLSYYNVENDGARFLRRGAEARIELNISKNTNLNDIISLLDLNIIPNQKVNLTLRRMIRNNSIDKYVTINLF